jgi:hypothetical protein
MGPTGATGPSTNYTSTTYNTALGYAALNDVTTGTYNIGIGWLAGSNLTSGGNNIDIGISGNSTDNGIIRIGYGSSAAFIAGIYGTTVSGGSAVYVDSAGQLGVQSSSARYKQDILPMADASSVLMELRPVSFRYKPQYDPSGAIQYGLIAEEVAEKAPQLVQYNAAGEPESVQYNLVNAMLLNEVQRQQHELDIQRVEAAAQRSEVESQHLVIEKQQATITTQQQSLQELHAEMAALARRLSDLEHQPH